MLSANLHAPHEIIGIQPAAPAPCQIAKGLNQGGYQARTLHTWRLHLPSTHWMSELMEVENSTAPSSSARAACVHHIPLP
eukprot:1157834-Pelagomonas_calceolata.AAC.6